VVDLSIVLTAPAKGGPYRSEWGLYNERNELLGVGVNTDQPLVVQITTSPGLITSDLGEPDWHDTFDNRDNWNSFSDQYGSLNIEGGRLVMVAHRTDGWDTWAVSYPTVRSFYMEAIVTTGENCAGFDRYGLIVRTQGSDKGYLLGFTCSGYHSIRMWTGSEFVVLTDWVYSEHILNGPSQTNHLTIKAEGSTFTLYANGKVLAIVANNKYPLGKFGPFIAATETNNFTAYFEEIAYWTLP
jgi:hypothetical protein